MNYAARLRSVRDDIASLAELRRILGTGPAPRRALALLHAPPPPPEGCPFSHFLKNYLMPLHITCFCFFYRLYTPSPTAEAR